MHIELFHLHDQTAGSGIRFNTLGSVPAARAHGSPCASLLTLQIIYPLAYDHCGLQSFYDSGRPSLARPPNVR